MKKKSVFYFGAVFAGLVGIIGSYFGKQYSKDDSLLVLSAHADVAPWAWGFGDGGGGDGDGGGGSGGCSDGDSGDGSDGSDGGGGGDGGDGGDGD